MLEALFRDLEEKVTGDLEQENVPRDQIKLLRFAGMRYSGQSYEVMVPETNFGADDLKDVASRFHEAHKRRYGHMAEGQPLEIVNFKAVGLGIIPKPGLREFAPANGQRVPVEERRPVYFGPETMLETPVLKRSKLLPGMEVTGPAVIEEKTSTTVLYPEQVARVDPYLNIEVRLPANE